MGRSKAEGGMGFRDLEGFNLALVEIDSISLLLSFTSSERQVFSGVFFLESKAGTETILYMEKYPNSKTTD